MFGMKVICSRLAVSVEEDWSRCRSPSRSKRRRAQGIKTRVVITEKPVVLVLDGNKMVVHPSIYQKMLELPAVNKGVIPYF